MQFKLDQVRTFIAVAESGSLNDAAKILDRTPSAISMSLKQFTEKLGDELFETDRKSTLTTLGHFVLEQSRNALKEFDESMDRVHRYAEGGFGSVRIASVPSFSTRILPGIAERFRKKLPDVNLELRDMDSVSINSAVRNTVVDFGIASNIGITYDLETELLLEEPFGVVCRTENLLNQNHTVIEWEQLESRQFINNGLCKLIKNSYMEQLRNDSKIHIYNIATLLGFISKGLGVTVLPRSAVPDHYNLCFLPLYDKLAIRQLFIMQRKPHGLNPAASMLKHQIQEYVETKNESWRH